MPFAYDARTGRYRDLASGRLVSDRVLADWQLAFARSVAGRVAEFGPRLAAGGLSLAAFETQMRSELKAAHLAAAMAAKGGRARMAPADYGFVGSQLRQQYRYLHAWAADLASGAAPLDGRIRARAELYGLAVRATAETIRRRERAGTGAEQERRVLGSAEHCADCVEYAGRGWRPVGTLPPIGASVCRMRCRCTFAYRAAGSRAA